MKYYCLQKTRHPWGDYFDILAHGLSKHKTDDGPWSLRRSGPYVPHVTLPYRHVIVDCLAKEALEAANLQGIAFTRVRVSKVVRLDWHKWNRSAADAKEYPESGEPEDYIEERKHSPATAKQMPSLWELTPALAGQLVWPKKRGGEPRLKLAKGAKDDVFRPEASNTIVFTEKALVVSQAFLGSAVVAKQMKTI